MGFNTPFRLQSVDHCKVVKTPIGPEDIQFIGKIGLSGVDDRLSLYEKINMGPEKTSRGGIIAINPFELSYYNLTLNDYPQNKDFHPLGLNIYQNKTLYVINFDYKSQGDKVEIFDITEINSKLQLKYQKSLNFKEKFMGQLNDIWTINDKEFYVTTWLPFPDDPIHGRDHSTFSSLLRKFYLLFSSSTYLFHCKIVNDTETDCDLQDKGHMFNGIIGDNQNRIFVVDSLGWINVYNITESHRLEKLNKFDIGFASDNIDFYEPEGELWVAGVRFRDYSAFIKNIQQGRFEVLQGGVLRAKEADGEWKFEEELLQNVHSGTSIGSRVDSLYLLGSWHDDQVLVCSLNK